jgi:hypothetical protein
MLSECAVNRQRWQDGPHLRFAGYQELAKVSLEESKRIEGSVSAVDFSLTFRLPSCLLLH